jgi:hypothetical protein
MRSSSGSRSKPNAELQHPTLPRNRAHINPPPKIRIQTNRMQLVLAAGLCHYMFSGALLVRSHRRLAAAEASPAPSPLAAIA